MRTEFKGKKKLKQNGNGKNRTVEPSSKRNERTKGILNSKVKDEREGKKKPTTSKIRKQKKKKK